MDSRRDPPFSPPPRRGNVGSIVLVICAVVALLYFGNEWARRQRPAALLPPPAPPAPTTVPGYAPSPQSAQNPAPAQSPRKITKCAEHGKTTYSDSGCAPTAAATQINARTDINLMDAPPPAPTPAPAQAPQPVVVAPYPPTTVSPNISPRAQPDTVTQCKQLEAEITYWDNLARQPQSGASQDWIRSQRQQVRDAQFRIPCR